MPRLFVALVPPPEIQRQLAAVCEGVAGARWTTSGHLHVTVRFLGSLCNERAAALALNLGGVEHRRFEAEVV